MITWLNDCENSNEVYVLKQKDINMNTYKTYTIYKRNIEYAVY